MSRFHAQGHDTVAAVADWGRVENPGHKDELKERAHDRRLGYDLGLDLRAGPPGREDWRVIWTNLYQLRNGRTAAGGDAQLFTSSLKFKLSDESRFAFGLTYDRGENLQSLDQSEAWRLVLGLRYQRAITGQIPGTGAGR